MNKKLTSKEIKANLKTIPKWKVKGGKLFREFVFPDFRKAFNFMSKSAIVADKMNHHPEWSNVYNKVRVSLSTHESKGITGLDFQLAEKMDKIAK